MSNFHLAVLDIGKTNKKVLIYDQELKLIDCTYKNFAQIDQGDFKSDDVEGIFQWFLSVLKDFSKDYSIKGLSISAHGATFVAVDKNGLLTIPEICYTTDPGEEFHREFYQQFGEADQLQLETATPNFMALLNVGKGIYYAKKNFPHEFEKTRYFLNLPQYFSYKLTGIATAEPTYVGCHSYLWDFNQNTWSSVAKQLEIKDKLPEKIINSWDVVGNLLPEVAKATGLPEDVKVTPGLHDSNASLLPYSITMKEPFVLNSTGTWCVVMREADQVQFAPDELGKVVFYNLNVFHKPVKTAIFLAGLEFETYTEILKQINQREDFPAFNLELYQQIVDENKDFILPGVTKGTGQFPDSEARVVTGEKTFNLADIQSGNSVPSFFQNYEYAYAVLVLSLAMQTKVALERTGMKPGIPVFTEGGFRRNECYNQILTAFYPESTIATTGLSEATAFGAALTALAGIEQKNPSDLRHLVHIEKNKVEPIKIKNLQTYMDKFLTLVG